MTLGTDRSAPPAVQQPPVTDVAVASTGLSWTRRMLMSPALALAVAIMLFVAYGSTQTEQFANTQTWINILRVAVFPCIVAVFATMVLVSGGLDLSVGSVLAAGAMTAAALADGGSSPLVAVVAGVAVGVGAGLVNGILINYATIPPIIVTLGTLFAVRSLVTAASDGNPIGPLPDSFVQIGQGELWGVPYLIYYALVVSAAAYVILHLTNFGWALRACGGNREAARSAGINVRRLSTAVYALSGASAALAGVLLAARVGSGSPGLGQGFELEVIAAAIIGGTSIAGAIGTVQGAMVGALLISVLGNGLVLLRVDATLQDLVTGIVLVAAAGLDQLRRRQMFRTSARSARSAG